MGFLRDYQEAALQNMHNGCILNGGVGSGKSRTSLAYFFTCNGGVIGDNLERMKNPKNLYIITTARKRDTGEWDDELHHYNMCSDPKINSYKNTIVIDSWNNIVKYKEVKDSFFIFDEQRVVGWGAWSKSFVNIAKHNEWILLSATPGDKWEDYAPVFIANGFYKNITEFRREHLVYKRYVKYPVVEKYVNTGRLIRLRKRTLVNMDFKRDTERQSFDIWCRYDHILYKHIQRDRWDPWKDEPLKNASGVCSALRQVCNSDPSRGEMLLQVLEVHPKAIIFYTYDYELEIMKNLTYAEGTKIAEWNGHAHEPIPDGEKWVYLVQYTSGCEGWNCTLTDTIIFWSQSYSYKQMEQARGRIDRMNTPFKTLYYYNLKSKSNIDLAISRALNNKEDFNAGRFYNRGG